MAEKQPAGRALSVVAVTGASGIVGQFVVQRLLAQGLTVKAASRRKSSVTNKFSRSDKLLHYTSDLRNTQDAQDLLDSCDALVHCAFAHAPGRYRGGEGADPQAFWNENLGATLNLLNCCAKLGTPRAILLSSRAVFGTTQSTVLRDESPLAPDTHYGALKRAEEALARLSVKQGVDTAALRCTGVYGMLKNPIESKWFHDAQQVSHGAPITRIRAGTEVHGDDVADAVWRLLTAERQTLNGQAFNCSDQLISTRMLARTFNALTKQNLPLPSIDSPTAGAMRCDRLYELGWQPGGTPKFEGTLAALIKAVDKLTP